MDHKSIRVVNVVLFFVCFIIASEADAQWSLTLGGSGNDAASSVIAISNGGVALAGYTTIGGQKRAYVASIANDGTVTWQFEFGNPSLDWDAELHQIIEVTSGGYVAIGTSTHARNTNAVHQEILILRISVTGTLLSQAAINIKGFENSEGLRILQTSDNGIMLSGRARNGTNATINDGFLIKMSANAPQTVFTQTWTKTYRLSNNSSRGTFGAVIEHATSDYQYVVSGFANPSGHQGHVVLFIKADGSIFETKRYEAALDQGSYSILAQTNPADGFMTVGNYWISSRQQCFYFLPLHADRSPKLHHLYGDSRASNQINMRTDNAKRFTDANNVTWFVSPIREDVLNANSDGAIIVVDENGALSNGWVHEYGGDDADWFTDVCRTDNGQFVGVGGSKSFPAPHGDEDIYVVMTDSAGQSNPCLRTRDVIKELSYDLLEVDTIGNVSDNTVSANTPELVQTPLTLFHLACPPACKNVFTQAETNNACCRYSFSLSNALGSISGIEYTVTGGTMTFVETAPCQPSSTSPTNVSGSTNGTIVFSPACSSPSFTFGATPNVASAGVCIELKFTYKLGGSFFSCDTAVCFQCEAMQQGLSLRIADVETWGDTIEVPLFLLGNSGVAINGVELALRYNTDLLEPIAPLFSHTLLEGTSLYDLGATKWGNMLHIPNHFFLADTTPLVILRFISYVTDTLCTSLYIDTLRFSTDDPKFTQCTPFALSDSTVICRNDRCGDSTIREFMKHSAVPGFGIVFDAANNQLRLDHSFVSDAATLVVYNQHGIELFSEDLFLQHRQVTVDANTLPTGMYMVLLRNKHYSAVRKLFIIR